MLDNVGKPIIVATHPRSGTHLTIDLLRKQFDACQGWLWFGETLHHLYLDLDHLAHDCAPCKSIEKAQRLLERAERPIIKTHSLPSLNRFHGQKKRFSKALLKSATIIYVVRDGRDVLCSTHVWMKNHHPEARCSLSRFLRQQEKGMSRVKQWAHHVDVWQRQDNVHIIHFEDVRHRPRVVIDQLAEILDLKPTYERPYLPEKVKRSGRWAAYWRRLTRQFESTAILGRYNGEKPQDWRTAFSLEDRRFFHEEAGDKLMEMGYVASDSWVHKEGNTMSV